MSSLGIFNKETKTYQKVAGTAEAAVVDAEMSDTSTNTVQNKVIKKYVDKKAEKSKMLSYMLSSNGWEGSTAPFTFTLNNITGVTENNNVELVVPSNISLAQVEAYQSAAIVTGTQAANSITLKAFGEKPTIDLPITVIVRGD